MSRLVVLVALLGSAIARADIPCASEVIDQVAFDKAIAIELQAVSAPYQVRLTCPTTEAVSVTISVRDGGASDPQIVSLRELGTASRPRALALVVAERVRALLKEPVRERDSSPAPRATPAREEVPPWMIVEHTRRVRLYRNLSIGFGVGAFALGVIGGGILGAAYVDPAFPVPQLVPIGATLLGVGGAALVGTGVALGFFIRERRHPPKKP